MKLWPLLAIALTGCTTVSPDPSIVAWGQRFAEQVAEQHAMRIGGASFEIEPTGSMEPFLTAGDYVVGDFSFPWENIQPADLLIYDPKWLDQSVPLVCHMAVERTGDGWIMTGIANRYSEAGSRALMRADYRAKVVAVYTSRKKP